MSKLDLSKIFYQLVVEEESRDKTPFCSAFGKYTFKRMPFALKNAPAHFQRMVETILRSCSDFSSPYIDDVLIFPKDATEHIDHIKSVLTMLREAGLTAKPSKCEWGKVYLTYLGHSIGKGKVTVLEARVEAIQGYKKSKSQKNLRAFLGVVGYYRKFIAYFAKTSRVLTPSTSPRVPKIVKWTLQMEDAFTFLKSMSCKHIILTVPHVLYQFQVQTDARHQGLGTVLNVIRDGVELSVCFLSRQLQRAEKNYSATEIEALGVTKAVEYWAHHLYGQRFEVVTDH